MAPVFLECEQHLQQQTAALYMKTYGDLLKWTSINQVYSECFSLLNSEIEDGVKSCANKGSLPSDSSGSCANKGSSQSDTGDVLLSLLLITSSLERNLGDIYLTMKDQCPSLLKDLLNTKELETILGLVVVNVLKLLIGSPLSLNLRNVAWHGFFSPGELPKRYVHFLLILIPSIGEVVLQKNMSSIPHRDNISLPSVIDVTYLNFDSKDINVISENSEFIPKCMMPYWNRILYYHGINQYGYSICLLWPVLEHSLRCLFAKVNNCPSRVLTAEATTLYTTFDEILAKMITKQDNKIVDAIGEPCMDLLMDILIYPEGPRIRDRLSHGEILISGFPEDWLNRTLYLAMYLINKFKDRNKVVDVPVPVNIKKIIDEIESYKSQYHPIAVLKKKIKNLLIFNSDMINWLKYDPDLNMWDIKAGCDKFTQNNSFYEELKSVITSSNLQLMPASFSLKAWCCEIFSNKIDLLAEILSQKISTLYRFEVSKSDMTCTSSNNVKEAEIINLLLRIVGELATVVTQLKPTVTSRQEKLLNKQLRSRQRENTQKLLICLPVYHLSINFIITYCIYLVYHLHQHLSQHLASLQRNLKTVLKFVENLRTFTCSDKNKWTEAAKLCLKHIQNICMFVTELHAL